MATAAMRNCIFVCYNETCENCFPTPKVEKKETPAEKAHRAKVIKALVKHARSLRW